MLATVHLFVFTLDQRRFGLRLEHTLRAVRMAAWTPLPRAPKIALGALNVAGVSVPVLDVRQRFGLPARVPGPEAYLLLAQTHKRTVALPVDSVEGIETFPESTIDPVGSVVPGLEYVQGLVRVADGELILIHDLDTLLSLEEERQLDDASAAIRT
jgi:purine-binding chemotaxis protein CheW